MEAALDRKPLLLRNTRAADDLEVLLVAAVVTILSIRFYLKLTGYPQIGGGHVHVAHMLWGGLLMLAALVVLFSYLGRSAARLAAILGGAGFGTFIDEIGKFVTRDNNYFFKPAIAMMYVTFILTFLVVRALQGRGGYTPEESLANALQELQEVARHDLNAEEKSRAQRLLAGADASNPFVAGLAAWLAREQTVSERPPGAFVRARRAIHRTYRTVAQSPRFAQGLVAFFIVSLLVNLGEVVFHLIRPGSGDTGKLTDLTFVQEAQLASSLLSDALVLAGILGLRRSRRFAYRMFKRSILVSIFLTQVFVFYERQFEAMLGLVFDVAVLVTLQQVLEWERHEAAPDVVPGRVG